MKIKLGATVAEDISGFMGVVTGLVHYISGCEQALIQPRCKDDGSLVEAHWFDVDRLDVLDRPVVRVGAAKTGFDIPAPKW
jgi:hypothetical protein